MLRRVRASRALLALAFLVLPFHLTAATTLGIDGTAFTIDGKPAFLCGISYYGALGAPDRFIQSDLRDLQRDGFNWIRVWANWIAYETNLSAIQGDGTPREPYLTRLEQLVKTCDDRGLIVDITLARHRNETATAQIGTLAEHLRAVETLVTRLRPWRNWYLDLANEREVGDERFVPMEELKALRERVRTLDPHRLVTASDSSSDADLLKHLEDYLKTVRLDFIAPHRSRARGTAAETDSATRRCLERMQQIGRIAPIQYQEPFRRGYTGWEPAAADFLADLRGALRGGAAGWCFHNGGQRGAPGEHPRRSFDLREKRLYDQLDPVELEVTRCIKTVLRTAKPAPHEPLERQNEAPKR